MLEGGGEAFICTSLRSFLVKNCPTAFARVVGYTIHHIKRVKNTVCPFVRSRQCTIQFRLSCLSICRLYTSLKLVAYSWKNRQVQR